MNPNDTKVVKASIVLILVIIIGFMLLFGGIFSAVGVGLRKSVDKTQEGCTVSAEAEVTEMKYNDDNTKTPVYSYIYNGKELTFHNDYYSSDPPYQVGDKAEILIDPDDPQRAFVPGDKTVYMVSTVFMVLGFGVLGLAALIGLIAAVLLIVVKSKSRREIKKEEPWLR